MISPALNITGKQVQQEIDHERKEKITLQLARQESPDEDPRKESPKGRGKESVTFEVVSEIDSLLTIVC